jgi:uroporphyrinogen decarboxylase
MNLTSKERISRILRHEPVDRIGVFEVFWGETPGAWSKQGHFASPAGIEDHFDLDLWRTSGGSTGTRLLNMVARCDAADELVEETETTRLIRDGNGALLRWLKNGSGAPEHVDFLVKDRAAWEEHIRPHLLDRNLFARRINTAGYRDMRAKLAREQRFLCAAVVGPFDLMTPVAGHEHLLAGMALDPDWVLEMADLYVTMTIEMLGGLFDREGLPDGLWVWEDLGFKERPFMSPAMYRELLFPAHRRLFAFAHSRGLPVILHSDGFVEPLLPDLIEAGIDCLQPLEVKAGMDLVKIKQTYGGKIALIGGMDARVLATNDLDAVRQELERKLPAAMAGSGYILQVDHSVPSTVTYETYKYFVDTGRRIGTYPPRRATTRNPSIQNSESSSQ